MVDRGYTKFGLWNVIHAKGSSYVCRVRDKIAATVTQANELTAADHAAGVISDEVVELGWKTRHRTRPDHPVRLICVEIQAYCAMIVCMLILIYTGEKPNRAMYQMVWYSLIGLASLKELEAFIRSRK
ncbi:MAG: hypothetical protein WCR51_07375 [Planctomycetia bacterium]